MQVSLSRKLIFVDDMSAFELDMYRMTQYLQDKHTFLKYHLRYTNTPF